MKIKNRIIVSAAISIILVSIIVVSGLVMSGRVAEHNKEHLILMDMSRGIEELNIVTYEYLLHHEKR